MLDAVVGRTRPRPIRIGRAGTRTGTTPMGRRPSAQLDIDGTFVIAYRVRDAAAGIARNVVARWSPGRPPTTLDTRPCVLRRPLAEDRRSCDSTTGRGGCTCAARVRCGRRASSGGPKCSKRMIPRGSGRDAREIFRDDDMALKDPVIRGPRRQVVRVDLLPPARLARRGRPDDDRTGDERRRAELVVAGSRARGRPKNGTRGRPPDGGVPDGSATYDGRASKEENFPNAPASPAGGGWRAQTGRRRPVSVARYLDVVETPEGPHVLRVSVARRQPRAPHGVDRQRLTRLGLSVARRPGLSIARASGDATTSQARRTSSPTGTIDRFSRRMPSAMRCTPRAFTASVPAPITIGATATMMSIDEPLGEEGSDDVGAALDQDRLGAGSPQPGEGSPDRDATSVLGDDLDTDAASAELGAPVRIGAFGGDDGRRRFGSEHLWRQPGCAVRCRARRASGRRRTPCAR